MILEPRSSVQVGHQFADAPTIPEGKPGDRGLGERASSENRRGSFCLWGAYTSVDSGYICVFIMYLIRMHVCFPEPNQHPLDPCCIEPLL